WCTTKLLDLPPFLEHPSRERFDEPWLVLIIFLDIAIDHRLDLVAHLHPIPDRTRLRIAGNVIVSLLRARQAIFDYIVGWNAAAQLLAAIGKQRIVDGKFSTVLHLFNAIGDRNVYGAGIVSIRIGRRRRINLAPPQPSLQLLGAKIEDGADFIL